MASRSRFFRKLTVICFSILVLLLMLADWLGTLLRRVLPQALEDFLKARSAFFAFCIVAAAMAGYVYLHYVEYAAFWNGHALLGFGVMLGSKLYAISVLSYLCRVYSERLLAYAWIRRLYGWYVAAKDFIHHLPWYVSAHRFIVRQKEKVRVAYRLFKERHKGSALVLLWRIVRRKKDHL